MKMENIVLQRPSTWLEVVCSARGGRAAVTVHPIATDDGTRIALALESRLLRSNNGRITLFEDLDAVSRFLALAGVRLWALGDPLTDVSDLLPGSERLRLRDGHLAN